jgi:predicted site-specific integrase-resolvase
MVIPPLPALCGIAFRHIAFRLELAQLCMTIVIFLHKDGLPCYNSRIYGHRTTGKEYLMAKTADTIAIYSRKSRYTGKGESIGNQIDLCREYIRTHYGDAAAEHTVVFEDEGFSGGNLNRPDFKKMMTAAKDRKFKAIVVYPYRQPPLRCGILEPDQHFQERETIFDGVPARRQEKGQALLHKL